MHLIMNVFHRNTPRPSFTDILISDTNFIWGCPHEKIQKLKFHFIGEFNKRGQ